MATLREVASRAGVSLATASRVASGAAAVRPDTRRRVEQAMRELFYVPPRASAAPLAAIGLFVRTLQSRVDAALADAVESHALEAGYATVLCSTHGSSERALEHGRRLLGSGIDRLILVGGGREQHDHQLLLLEHGARLVLVNGRSTAVGVPWVAVDERLTGRIAAEHLLGLGHRRLAFVAAHAGAHADERRLGHRDALQSAGLPVTIATAAGPEPGSAREAVRRLLALPEGARPTALVCTTDAIAMGAVHACAALGLRVPQELSVVGLDGSDAAELAEPPLTTVAQPVAELARTSVEALLAPRGAGSGAPSYVFEPFLRPGGTTAPPA
jgi:DNA-binding LacI/PurR family transcriptional regulator